MKHQLTVLSQPLHHILHPLQGVIAVQTAKPDIGALAFAVSPLIHHHQAEALVQIKFRNGCIVVESFAGIAVKAHHCPPGTFTAKECAVESEPVPGCYVHIFLRLSCQPFPAGADTRNISVPVRARHLLCPVPLCISPDHGPVEEIPRYAVFSRCSCCRQSQHPSFDSHILHSFTAD